MRKSQIFYPVFHVITRVQISTQTKNKHRAFIWLRVGRMRGEREREREVLFLDIKI